MKRRKQRWTARLYTDIVSRSFIMLVFLFLLLAIACGNMLAAILIALYMVYLISNTE